ncbi:hypothetical protein prwr041_05460 [Prevotella herbatica]|uniref:Uncharacterized protein n=1 Tax=Prevotella herbatica TaxID=2801997 RepID=A0ABN6EFG8_9BACT|nr:hypothetical protein prwr041_05460 [Prevotella herbatica]
MAKRPSASSWAEHLTANCENDNDIIKSILKIKHKVTTLKAINKGGILKKDERCIDKGML